MVPALVIVTVPEPVLWLSWNVSPLEVMSAPALLVSVTLKFPAAFCRIARPFVALVDWIVPELVIVAPPVRVMTGLLLDLRVPLLFTVPVSPLASDFAFVSVMPLLTVKLAATPSTAPKTRKTELSSTDRDMRIDAPIRYLASWLTGAACPSRYTFMNER